MNMRGSCLRFWKRGLVRSDGEGTRVRQPTHAISTSCNLRNLVSVGSEPRQEAPLSNRAEAQCLNVPNLLRATIATNNLGVGDVPRKLPAQEKGAGSSVHGVRPVDQKVVEIL